MSLLQPRIVQELGVNVEPEESPGLNGLVSVPMAEHLHKKLKTGRNFYNNKPGPYWRSYYGPMSLATSSSSKLSCTSNSMALRSCL